VTLDAHTYATAPMRKLGRMLRAGETTSAELTEHALQLLETRGRALNAVVTVTRDRALREAVRADAELAAGHDRGPLHGIPYGAKDLLATANIPTTWGAAPYRDQVFDFDATVIRKLEAAGAVLVAKLAMVELAGGMGYDAPDASFTGPGRTPWDTNRWSGGSSSGSGAAVGGRIVPFAIGSETSGSIMSPAANCGTTGLRPTYGRVSRHGAMALCWSLDKLGPLARTADDCGLVLGAIAGPDVADPTAVARRYRYAPDSERTEGFRFALPKGATDGIEDGVREAFEASLAVLRGMGTVEEVALPEFPYGAVIQHVIFGEASSAFDSLIASGGIADLTNPQDRVTPYALPACTAVDYLRAMRIRSKIAAALEGQMQGYDAMVAPTAARLAPPIDQPFNRDRPGGLPLIPAGNLAGQPAVSVPNGFGEDGLPTGLMLIGAAFTENRLLAAASAFQERTAWHLQLPPGVG